jgi:hypothetical protein
VRALEGSFLTLRAGSLLWGQVPYSEGRFLTLRAGSSLWGQVPHSEGRFLTLGAGSSLWGQVPHSEGSFLTLRALTIYQMINQVEGHSNWKSIIMFNCHDDWSNCELSVYSSPFPVLESVHVYIQYDASIRHKTSHKLPSYKTTPLFCHGQSPVHSPVRSPIHNPVQGLQYARW